MKYLLIINIVLLFTGCFSVGVRGNYKSYQKEFYNLVSNPIEEHNRKELENKFEKLRDVVSMENISKKEKDTLLKDIDYYLMLLKDLED